MAVPNPSTPWGAGDLVAIFVGILYTPLGIWLLPERRTVEGI